jgi:hypothetical protein
MLPPAQQQALPPGPSMAGRTPITPMEGMVSEAAAAQKVATSEGIRAALADLKAARKAVDPEAYQVRQLVRRPGEDALKLALKWADMGKKAQAVDGLLGTKMADNLVGVPALPDDIAKGIGGLDNVALAKALDVKPELLEQVVPQLTPSAKAFLDAVAVSKGLDSGLAGKALQVAIMGAKLGAAVPIGGIAALSRYGVRMMGGKGARMLLDMISAGRGIKDKIADLADLAVGKLDAPLKGISRGVSSFAAPGASATVVLFNNDVERDEDESDAEYEVRQVIESLRDPEGARQSLDDSLLVARGVNSRMGNALAEKRMQQLGFLYSKIPPSQKVGGFKSNSIKIPMSPIEEAEWRRTKVAVVAPEVAIATGIKDKTLDTTTVNTVKEIWPEMFAQLQQQILTRLYQRKTPPAYEDRIVLSKLLDGNYEQSLDVTTTVQNMYRQNNEQQVDPVKGVPKAPDSPTTTQRIAST